MRLGIALCLAALLAASCGAPEAAKKEHGAALYRGNAADPDSLDPQKTSTVYESNILYDLFEGLMTMDAAGKPVYGAAVAHTVSPDGLLWTFDLREEKWSDGTPLTADDFVFSFHRILDPKTAAKYASLLYPIKNAQAVNEGRLAPEQVGVRAVGARRLEIALERPTPYFLQLLTHITCQPVPKHLVERLGDRWVKPGVMATNGPYVPLEWVPNAHIKLGKNPHYYDVPNVSIDTVYYLPIGDEAIELKRFRAGEIDFTDGLPARALGEARKDFGDQVKVFPTFDSHYLLVNVRKPPFDDSRVRQALSLAIDREAIAGQVLNAGQTPAYSFVPIGIANYERHAELGFKSLPLSERRAKARQLLAAAGYGPARPLELTYRYRDSIDSRRIAVAVQDMWRQIGVEASLLNSEGKVHSHALRTQDFEIAHANWVADYNDAENYLFLFESTSGQMNYTKYSNPAYDALMERASLTLDLTQRAEILRQAELMLLDEAPVLPLFFNASRRLVRNLEGYENNALNYHRTRYLKYSRGPSETPDPGAR